MPAYKKKAAICLASGDTEGDTAQQVNVHVSIIHQWLREDDFNAYLNSLKRELKPEKKQKVKPEKKQKVLKWIKFDKDDETTHPKHGQKVLAYDCLDESRVCRFDSDKKQRYAPFLISTFKTDNTHSFSIFSSKLNKGDHGINIRYDNVDVTTNEVDAVIEKLEQELYKHVMSHRPYFSNVIAWMPLPEPAHSKNNFGDILLNENLNDEYLLEQTALETFDIIDAITPALRDAVKHLLVQQGANK